VCEGSEVGFIEREYKQRQRYKNNRKQRQRYKNNRKQKDKIFFYGSLYMAPPKKTKKNNRRGMSKKISKKKSKKRSIKKTRTVSKKKIHRFTKEKNDEEKDG
jgi:hypothetical protein